VLITCPLANQKRVWFTETNVSVHASHLQSKSRLARSAALLKFGLDLTRIRWQYRHRLAVEIAYEPNAAFFSDRCPFRSHLRVAHLHEALINPENWFYEKHAVRRLHTFDRVVVADEDRADLLSSQIDLSERPLVLPNYPLLDDGEFCLPDDNGAFETVYAGSLGKDQALDSVIRSVNDWQPRVRLNLVGSTDTPMARELQALVDELGVADRVIFHGQMPLTDVQKFLRKCHLGFSFLRDHHDQWRYATGASNKRYQYMQAGRPQISDRNPGVPALIEQQGVGRCVVPDDLSGIAQAVNFYASSPAECTRAGQHAYQLYRRQYHYELPFREFVEWVNRDWERRQETVTQRDTRHAAIH
ncbi:MAG TPA: glycosyltransferase, partial [Fuerstia sp.]|nr:glycosyltransferase [Fuerstiella sp.]